MKRILFTLFGTLAVATAALTAGIEIGNPQVADGVEVGNPHVSGGSNRTPARTVAGGTEVGNG